MSIKIEVSEDREVKELPFPKLMESKDLGLIALFSSEGFGTVVFSNGEYRGYYIGYHSGTWAMEDLQDCRKSVKLENPSQIENE